MRKNLLLLTLLAFWPLFLIFGCAPQMTWQERYAQQQQLRKQREQEAFWKSHPCHRLLTGNVKNLDNCLQSEERHSKEYFKELIKKEAVVFCNRHYKDYHSRNDCESAYIADHDKSSAEIIADEMCIRNVDWPECKDYWMEFIAWHCRLPSQEEIRREEERLERKMEMDNAFFRQHMENEYLINELERIMIQQELLRR